MLAANYVLLTLVNITAKYVLFVLIANNTFFLKTIKVRTIAALKKPKITVIFFKDVRVIYFQITHVTHKLPHAETSQFKNVCFLRKLNRLSLFFL